MKSFISEYVDFRGVAAALLVVAFASCNSSSSLPSAGSSTTTSQSNYIQIERLARPAIKEAFANFTDHDATNQSSPYNDPSIANSIKTFTGTFRASQFGTALAGILVPDELQANLGNSTAGYLGVEAGVANAFGGRALTDDVIDASLGAIFGKTLVTLGVADDGKEIPCLTTDNEPGSNTADGNTTIASITAKNGVSNTFPYIGSAH